VKSSTTQSMNTNHPPQMGGDPSRLKKDDRIESQKKIVEKGLESHEAP